MITNYNPTFITCWVDFRTYILLRIKKFFFKSIEYTDSLYTNLNFGSFLKSNWPIFVLFLFVPALLILIGYKYSENAIFLDFVIGLVTNTCTILLGLFLYYKTWVNDKTQYFANAIHVNADLLYDNKNYGLFYKKDIELKNYRETFHGGVLSGKNKNRFIGIELINLNSDVPIKVEYQEMYISQMNQGINKFGKMSVSEFSNSTNGELIDYKQCVNNYLGFDDSILVNYNIDLQKTLHYYIVYKVSNLRKHSCYLIVTIDVNKGKIFSISQVLIEEKMFDKIKSKYGPSIITILEKEIIVGVYLFNKNITPQIKHLDRKFHMIDYIYFRNINRFYKEEKIDYIQE